VSPATWQRAVVLAVILCGGPAWAVAEDIPAVFLHGFNSDGTGWAATAERLRAQTAIEPRTPDLPWRQAFGDQTRDLWARPDYAGLPHDTVLVGHSNGGLVARESSRWRSLGGLVTIGSPHRGVPILPQFGHWATFGSWTSSLVASVVSEFARSTDWNWVFAYIVGSLNWAMDFSIWSVAYLGGLLGLDQALPVAAEVRPDSTYLQDLNSSWNLDREMQALDGRVGVVSIARNFYWAGPARVVGPPRVWRCCRSRASCSRSTRSIAAWCHRRT
jgi:pimeloyl-ACP methyl ester carboxylesterase